MSAFRIFAALAAGLSALILVLSQTLEAPERAAAPELEPLPTVGPTSTAAPTQPREATLTPPSVPPPGPEPIATVVYEHDFSSFEDGLLAGQSVDSATNEFGARTAEYTDAGTLLVSVESSLNTYVAGASSEGVPAGGLSDLADVSIEADVTPVEYGAGGAWGLACRRERGAGTFYFGVVRDTEGQVYAAIIRQDAPGGTWVELGAEPIPAGMLLGEGQTNRLRLDCIGSTITLYADGQEVAHGEDDTYRTGSVALFANPLVHGSAVVEFDNLVIREAT